MQKLSFPRLHIGAHPDTPLRFTKADLCPTCHRLKNMTDEVRAALIKRMDECGVCKRNNLLYASTCSCEAMKPVEHSIGLYHANLPPPRKGVICTFANFERRRGTEVALKATQEWAAGRGAPLLFLNGSQGTGKSHLIEAALRHAFEQGRQPRYEYTPDLLAALRPSDTEGHDERQRETLYWKDNAVFLGLDDIGAEKATDFVREQLLRIIDGRIRHGERLVVSTNLTLPQMTERLGARITDRLYDKNSDVVMSVELKCTSYRTGR